MNADGSSRRADDILFYIAEPSECSKGPVIAEGILMDSSWMIDGCMNECWMIKL